MPRPKRSKIAPSAPVALPKALPTSAPVPAQTATLTKRIAHPDSASHSSSAEQGTNFSDDSEGFVKTLRKDKGQNDAPTMSGALAQSDIGATRLRPVSGKEIAELSRVVRQAERTGREVARSAGQREKEEVQVPSSQGPGNVVGGFRNGEEERVGTVVKPSTGLGISAMKAFPALSFKKRPRQPSLLQLIEPQNDISSSDDLDDFNPDDESTPFILESKSQIQDSPTSSPSQHLSVSRKRKITPPEIQVPRSQSASQTLSNKSPSQAPETQQLFQATTPLASPSPSPSPSSPEPVLPTRRSITERPNDPSNSLLAPPISSSPQPSPPPRTLLKPNPKPARKIRKPAPSRAAPSPGPSPLSNISIASFPTRPSRITAPKPLTTASLQNLLPKRRRKAVVDAFDIPDSSDVEIDTGALEKHEDELSYHASRKPTVRKAGAIKGKKVGGAKSGGRTYTRKKVVGKEKQDLDGGDEGNGDGGKGTGKKAGGNETKRNEEFERLRKKFAEVDEWELEVEDITQGSSSHGMGDAR